MVRRKKFFISLFITFILFYMSNIVLAADNESLEYENADVVQYTDNQNIPISSTSEKSKSKLATVVSEFMNKLGVTLPCLLYTSRCV